MAVPASQLLLTVLHLDDNSSDALLVRRQLGRDLPGVDVRWVATEKEFKLALAREEIQVIVSDYNLPKFNGLSAISYSRAHYPLIPIIILSAYDDPKTVRAALRSGASDYVFKVELKELGRAIAQAARFRSVEQHARELLRERSFGRALRKVLEVSVSLLKADRGAMQLFEETANELRLAESIGFSKEFVERFRTLPSDSSTACGRAFQRRERVVVEDIHLDPDFQKLGSQCDSYEFKAVQSTPLRGRNGKTFAVLSTHYDRPRRPSEDDLQALDLYIKEAERVFELLEARGK